MFDHLMRVAATLAFCAFIVTCDSLPTWVLVIVAGLCAVALILELVAVEEYLNDDDTPTSDTPIADQVAREQNFDFSNLDVMDRNEQFRRDFDKEL